LGRGKVASERRGDRVAGATRIRRKTRVNKMKTIGMTRISLVMM